VCKETRLILKPGTEKGGKRETWSRCVPTFFHIYEKMHLLRDFSLAFSIDCKKTLSLNFTN